MKVFERQSVWGSIPLRIVLPSLLTVALFTVAVFGVVLPRFEATVLEAKREKIREITQAVWTTLKFNHQEELRGHSTRAQAQQCALDSIRNLRYGLEGKDYFWINDMHPRMVLHPHRPEMEGQDLTNYADPRGSHLFVEAARVARENGEGCIDYMWQWNDDPSRIVPKLSYVKEFKPWGWVIGTGVYLEDVRAQTAAMSGRLIKICLGVLLATVILSGYVILQSVRGEKRRRAIEAERLRLTAQLHQSQKIDAIGQLASGVAHDINNLLTVVLASTHAIRSKLAENDPVLAAVRTIEKATQQATGVTRSLLTFSQKTPSAKEPQSLANVVAETTRMLRSVLPSTISLRTSSCPDALLWAKIDRTQIQQVVMNLAINARDAMPDGGHLDITLSAAPTTDADAVVEDVTSGIGWVCLTVSDTGMGMPAATKDRVFEPFFTTKARGEGTGLGLSIVHGIIEDHGGRIECESKQGEGSAFCVWLPRVEPTADSGEEPSSEYYGSGGELILLAEDRRFVREALASTLQSLGYEILPAADGRELLRQQYARAEDIRLLLLDVDLPHRSGLDCLRTFRGEGVTTPAIVITGSVEFDEQSELDGNSHLLRKPFSMCELGDMVRRILSPATSPEEVRV